MRKASLNLETMVEVRFGKSSLSNTKRLSLVTGSTVAVTSLSGEWTYSVTMSTPSSFRSGDRRPLRMEPDATVWLARTGSPLSL